MEYLAIALVVIFVLHLIDRNKVWKQAAKVAAVLVGLAILGIGGLYAYSKYQDWKEQKQQAALAAQQAAEHQAAVRECLKRFADPNDKFNIAACEADPSQQPDGRWQIADVKDIVPQHPAQKHLPLKQVKNTSSIGIEMTTTELGDLKCGEVQPNEVVTLVAEGQFGSHIKVKTAEGKIGWVTASFFEVVDK